MAAAPIVPRARSRKQSITMSIRYPYSRQNIAYADIAAVAEALRDPLITQGRQVPAFEQAFSRTLGGAQVLTCSNGTAALHMAYLALQLGPEGGLLTSPVTFLS